MHVGTTQAPRFAAALDAFFDWFYRINPVSATFIGRHDYDHVLPDFSNRGLHEAVSALKTMRTQFSQLPSERLNGAERLDRMVVEGIIDIQLWELSSRHFQRGNPSLYTGEAIFGVLSLLLRPFAPLPERLDAAISRLNAVPAFLRGGQENLSDAPQAWTARAIRECDGALAFFDRGIDVLIREGGLASTSALRNAAQTATDAFHTFRSFLSTDLMTRRTGDHGCGTEALELVLRRGHFLPMRPEDVLVFARRHLSAGQRRLTEIALELGESDWRRGIQRLADYHPSFHTYYQKFEDVAREARAAAEEHELVRWPDSPLRFVPQPTWAREAAPYLYFLFYRAPAAFDRLPVVDYHVTPITPELSAEEQSRRLRATNDSAIKLNHVIHHGGLGHHVQNWYAYYRAASRIGQVAAVDCASRIALFCGGTMAEGWACYATDLMEEIGFLSPLERLAHAYSRLRMAARAIADVQLHTAAWTLDETAQFYRDTVDMPVETARSEAVKNSMFPGTALMYLCGTEMIHDLRRDMQARSGFNLREFHDRFLSYGSLPVALIAAEMRREVSG